MHALFGVGVQLGQPDGRLLCVLTLLCNAQPSTPLGLHTIIVSVLCVVAQLGAPRTFCGTFQYLGKLSRAVLEQGHGCRRQGRGGGIAWTLARNG